MFGDKTFTSPVFGGYTWSDVEISNWTPFFESEAGRHLMLAITHPDKSIRDEATSFVQTMLQHTNPKDGDIGDDDGSDY